MIKEETTSKKEEISHHFSVRDYSPQDRSAIVRLWQQAYSQDHIAKRIGYFIRLAEGNYLLEKTKAATYNVLLDHDKIIGYIGTMPAMFYIRGKKEYGLYLHDSLIDKAYRGKGLGLYLMKEVTSKSKSFIIALWMNEAQYNLTKKSGWSDIAGCYSYIRILNPGNYLGIKNNIFSKPVDWCWKCIALMRSKLQGISAADYKLEAVNSFDEAINDFISSACLGYTIIQNREKDYLNWKFADFPTKHYYKFLALKQNKLMGYVVLCEESSPRSDKVGMIADVLVKKGDSETFDFMIAKSVEFFQRRGSDYITCFIIPDEFKKVLKKRFFFKSRQPVTLMFTGFDNVISREQAMNCANWYLTYGDDDRVIW